MIHTLKMMIILHFLLVYYLYILLIDLFLFMHIKKNVNDNQQYLHETPKLRDKFTIYIYVSTFYTAIALWVIVQHYL